MTCLFIVVYSCWGQGVCNAMRMFVMGCPSCVAVCICSPGSALTTWRNMHFTRCLHELVREIIFTKWVWIVHWLSLLGWRCRWSSGQSDRLTENSNSQRKYESSIRPLRNILIKIVSNMFGHLLVVFWAGAFLANKRFAREILNEHWLLVAIVGRCLVVVWAVIFVYAVFQRC